MPVPLMPDPLLTPPPIEPRRRIGAATEACGAGFAPDLGAMCAAELMAASGRGFAADAWAGTQPSATNAAKTRPIVMLRRFIRLPVGPRIMPDIESRSIPSRDKTRHP